MLSACFVRADSTVVEANTVGGWLYSPYNDEVLLMLEELGNMLEDCCYVAEGSMYVWELVCNTTHSVHTVCLNRKVAQP